MLTIEINLLNFISSKFKLSQTNVQGRTCQNMTSLETISANYAIIYYPSHFYFHFFWYFYHGKQLKNPLMGNNFDWLS